MTTDYSTMEAGEELNRIVAERVMGWTCPSDYNYWLTIHAGGTFDLHAHKASWSPSTNIEAAWQVISRMIERKYTWVAAGHGGSSSCHFLDNGRVVGNANAETFPLAICRAALLATQEE